MGRRAIVSPSTCRWRFGRNMPIPKVRQDAGRVALMRGPLVYCVETTDNGEDLNAIVLPRELSAAETVVLEGSQ